MLQIQKRFFSQPSMLELALSKNNLQLAELIMETIPKVMQVIREDMREGRGERLSVAQFRVLAAINRGINHNKDLGDRLGVTEAAISRMIDLMEQDGLIKKSTNKTDRRQTDLSLSAEGAKLFNVIKSDAKYKMKKKLSALTVEEAEALTKGLEILRDNSLLFS